MLTLALSFPICAAHAADATETAESAGEMANPAGNPVDQFTGEYWMKSSPENKEAYLFGIDSALTVEVMINRQQFDKSVMDRKKKQPALSPFVSGWMKAFKDMSRKQIVAAVDKWYQDNPDQLNRPVMGVIWYEVIEPRLDMKK